MKCVRTKINQVIVKWGVGQQSGVAIFHGFDAPCQCIIIVAGIRLQIKCVAGVVGDYISSKPPSKGSPYLVAVRKWDNISD